MDRTTHPHPRARRLRRLLAIGAMALGVTTGAVACGEPEPPPPPPACASVHDATIQRVYDSVNIDRAGQGLGPLEWDGDLACNAQDWADHLASITTLVHQDLPALLASPGYAGTWNGLGENLLAGNTGMTGDTMADVWINSPHHRDNILGPFTSVGVAMTRSPDGRLWVVQEFGRRR
jgi:hypothetical protein